MWTIDEPGQLNCVGRTACANSNDTLVLPPLSHLHYLLAEQDTCSKLCQVKWEIVCISFMHHFHPQISTIQDVLPAIDDTVPGHLWQS